MQLINTLLYLMQQFIAYYVSKIIRTEMDIIVLLFMTRVIKYV